MELLDWCMLGVCISAAVGGFRLGLVTRAFSWMGMLAGVYFMLLLLPAVLRQANSMSEITRFGVAVLLLLTGSLLGKLVGLLLGSRISATLPSSGALRLGDQVSGAFAGVLGALIGLWLILPIAANIPGWWAQQVRSSVFAQVIYEHSPDSPDALLTLRHLVGQNGFPSVFEGIGPAPEVGPIPTSVSLPSNVIDMVKASTVKVEGTACRRTQNGSGFAVAPGLIATNAHVVAGEKSTYVVAPNGDRHKASVVAFDPERDLALLSTELWLAPLPITSASEGQSGAVFGHPGGQEELAISPATVHRKIVAVGRDLYDAKQTHRDVLILASSLHQGDSGAALINNRGEVIGVAFAIAPDKPGTSYALNTSELKELMGGKIGETVSTGPCLHK